MRIVVTGITGFVGGALARALAQEGRTVAGLVRPASDPFRISNLNVELKRGDVTNPASLTALFEPGDWVIHAAGMLGQSGIPDATYQQLHVEGTRNTLAAAVNKGAARILYISSPGVLGPIDGEPADETTPPAPSNPYERSKAAAERVALDFAVRGAPVVIARPEFIYGPGDLHVLGLFRAVQKGMFFYIGAGQSVCHPTYIDDAVQGMLLCLKEGKAGEVYHITGPRPVAFQEYGQTIAGALGVRPPWLRVPKVVAWLGALGLEAVGKAVGKTPPLSRTGVAFFSENRRFSWEKARKELGYFPEVDLAEGVKRTADWYHQQNLL